MIPYLYDTPAMTDLLAKQYMELSNLMAEHTMARLALQKQLRLANTVATITNRKD